MAAHGSGGGHPPASETDAPNKEADRPQFLLGWSAHGWSVDYPIQLRREDSTMAGARSMTGSDLRKWMQARGWNPDSLADKDALAASLGVSRRAIYYYLSGERPIPRMMELALEALAARG